MKVEEFFRYLTEMSIENVLGNRAKEFLLFVSDNIRKGKNKIIVRFVLEIEEYFIPYYVWGVYELEKGDSPGELTLYFPDFSDANSYLGCPEEIKGEQFFEIHVGNDGR